MYLKKILAAASCAVVLTPVCAQEGPLGLTKLWQQTFEHYPSHSFYQSKVDRSLLEKELLQRQAAPSVLVQAQQAFGTYGAAAGSFFPLPGF
jgi:hypothetical protein